MPLAHAAADGVDHRNHILHRMRHHVAQQQIIAEAVTDLRHFSGSRSGMKPERNAEFLQADHTVSK